MRTDMHINVGKIVLLSLPIFVCPIFLYFLFYFRYACSFSAKNKC